MPKSIRPASPVTDRVKVGFHIDGAQLTYTYVSLKDLLQSAYNLRNYQILGPEFVSTDRYDVAAKIPAGGHRDEVVSGCEEILPLLSAEVGTGGSGAVASASGETGGGWMRPTMCAAITRK